MPRPRKPTKVLQLTGRIRHDPQIGRERENEPTDNAPLGGPPVYLAPTEREIWLEIQAELVDGVALASDRRAFETLVRLEGLQRTSGVGGLDGAQLSQKNKLYTLFGMTPSDRSRVSAPKGGKKANRFQELG